MWLNWRPKYHLGKIAWEPKWTDGEPEQKQTLVALAGTEVSPPSGYANGLAGEPEAQVATATLEITEHSPPFGSVSAVADRAVTIVRLSGTARSTPAGAVASRSFAAPDVTEAQAIQLARRIPPVRQPDDSEQLVAFDFRAYLFAGETITKATVSGAVPGFEAGEPSPRRVLLGPPGIAGRLVAQWIGGGTPGVRYLITCTVETSTGRRLERSYSMRVLGKWRTSPRVV